MVSMVKKELPSLEYLHALVKTKSDWTIQPNIHLQSHRKDLLSLKLTASAPDKRPSQKETSIPTIHLRVLY